MNDKTKPHSNLPEKLLPIKPLTRAEMHEAAHKRVSVITKELSSGFEFLEDYPRSVTFFGSARFAPDHVYYQKALSLGKRVASDLGYTVFTGGGPGIMEAANRGAFEAHGSSVGITIELPHEQITNSFLTDHISLYYFFTRKVCLSFSAEAYIFFPGGFGTLDEFFEIICLVQTRKIQSIPIILVGETFWRPLETFMKEQLLALGTIDAEDLDLYTITDDEDKIIETIRKVPVRAGLEYARDL